MFKESKDGSIIIEKMKGEWPMNAEKKLIDVAHVSKRGSSLRISIPKKVAESIGISEGEILGFYSDGERTFVERIE